MKLLLTLAACAAAQQLDLQLSEDGSFEIAFDGVAWLRGGDVLVDGRSAAAGDFTLAARTRGAGVDALGAFAATSFFWEADCFELAINATFKTYADDPSIVVFEQAFPHGSGRRRRGAARRRRRAHALPGVRARGARRRAGARVLRVPRRLPADGELHARGLRGERAGRRAAVLYDARAAGGALPMLVFSPLDRPKAQHMATTDRLFARASRRARRACPRAGRSAGCSRRARA